MALLAAYNFDEASGAVVDVTGNGHDFTITANITRQTGHTNTGLRHESTAADSGGPTIFGQTAQRTLMCWVKRTSNGVDGWIVEMKDGGASTGLWGFLFTGVNLQARTKNPSSAIFTVQIAQPVINVWYHAAMTFDGAKLHLFINGVEQGTGTTVTGGSLHTGATIFPFFDTVSTETVIDDVRVYDAALDAATITTLMGTPVTGASTVTGTIAGTLPAFTSSITSTVRVSGAAAGSLPAMTGSLTGTARVSGTESGTLPALTGSVTATARASATITATLPGLTGNLSGSLELSGSISGNLPALTGALSGNVSTPGTPATGTLSGTLPALQGSVSGGVKASGTFTGQLPAFTSTVTGRARVSATLSGMLQAILGALTGTAGPVVEYEAPDDVIATPRSGNSTATPLPGESAASGRVSEPSTTARQYVSTATARSPE